MLDPGVNEDAERALRTFVDTTRWRGGAGDLLQGRAAVHRDPAGLEERADRNVIKFNQELTMQRAGLGRDWHPCTGAG